MGAGAVSGHSSARGNQIFPTPPPSDYSSADIHPSGTRSQPSVSQSQAPAPSMSNKVQSCETCDNNFSFFKRKKICRDCHRIFCSTCLPKPPSSLGQSGRQCAKCTILTSGKFTRADLQAWRVKDMRCFLDNRNIPTSMCKEKHDLIDLLLLHFCLESSAAPNEQREHDRLVGELADRMRNSSFYSSPTLPHQVPDDDDNLHPSSLCSPTAPPQPAAITGQSEPTQSAPTVSSSGQAMPEDVTRQEEEEEEDVEMDVANLQHIVSSHLWERQQREMREAMERLQEELMQDEPESRPGVQRTTIDDIQSEEDVENLTVRQLKEILVNNFVDYKGCCEKHELADRVRRLWVETQANRQRVATALGTTAEEGATTSSSTETSSPGAVPLQGAPHDSEKDICKICMDAPIDCILLECGHMITCTKCGKRLADCPICRQYITRVVHVFRS